MENEQKKLKILYSKKKKLRRVLRKSFKTEYFSLVPFEIWKDIVGKADVKSLAFLSQTCWAFQELVELEGEENVKIAFEYRKEGQIALALKFLEKCANSGDLTAMLHIGSAYGIGGSWGLKIDAQVAAGWFKKLGEAGIGSGLSNFAFSLKHGYGSEKDDELSEVWAKKALSSNDYFAIACCHCYGLGTAMDKTKAFKFFEISAVEGHEYAQNMLGFCYKHESGTERDEEKAFYWYKKSGEQGLALSQYELANMYLHGEGCEKDQEKAKIWFKKAAKQGNLLAMNHVTN